MPRPILRISIAVLAIVAVAALCVAPGETQTPRKGGVLRMGTIGELPTLDAHATTAVPTREININVLETLKVDLQVADWATVVQRRGKGELWDAFSTAFVFVPEPSTSIQVSCDWPGWWCNAEKDQMLQQMARELDPKKRYAIWEKVQAVFYAEAGRIKVGDYFRLDARRKDVQGHAAGPYLHFWNVWLDKK